jgi:TPR repeat protein
VHGIALTEQDIQKARENDPETLYKIGDAYNKKEYFRKAFAWFYKAALQDYPQAQAKVGDMYHRGRGKSRDYKQAMDWYLKAVNNGNTDAMKEIGVMYQYGEGVTRNTHTAIEWYTKAANQGNAWAQYRLGRVYEKYDEVKNLQKAVNWYQKVADSNYYAAKNELKRLNEQGYYAKDDVQKGILISCINFMKLIIKNSKHSSRIKRRR